MRNSYVSGKRPMPWADGDRLSIICYFCASSESPYYRPFVKNPLLSSSVYSPHKWLTDQHGPLLLFYCKPEKAIKKSSCQILQTHWRPCDVTLMITKCKITNDLFSDDVYFIEHPDVALEIIQCSSAHGNVLCRKNDQNNSVIQRSNYFRVVINEADVTGVLIANDWICGGCFYW